MSQGERSAPLLQVQRECDVSVCGSERVTEALGSAGGVTHPSDSEA